MSPKLPIIRADDLIRVLIKLGFSLDRQRGSHAIYIRDKDRKRAVVPIHKGKDLKPKTLKGILTDIDISVEEFDKLL